MPPQSASSNPGQGVGGKMKLRTRIFKEQNAILDDLVKNEHSLPVYNAFVAVILCLILHTAVHDYVYNGRINFGQRLILYQFSTFGTFWFLWILAFITNFLAYYSFKLWATVRTGLPKTSSSIKLWDRLWLGLTVIYYPGWFCVATWATFNWELTITLRIALYIELTRMLMKVHAYIRSNAPRVLSYKPHSEQEQLYPSVSQFVYFLWAPTLIYRDSYPRTNSIRWSCIAKYVVDFLLALLWISATMERYFINNFKDYGLKHYSLGDISVIIFGNAGAGMFIILAVMWLILYSWMNAFAELCTFSDRRFVEDWWRSTDYERYYRTWNVLVHDWLYTYVYKDFYEIIVPGSRVVAKYAVFFLSAIFHEYVLILAFRFFLPVLFIQFFTFGTLFTYLKINHNILGNTFLLYTLALGNGITLTFFSLEYYARSNCPIDNPTLLSYVVPRMLSCNPDV